MDKNFNLLIDNNYSIGLEKNGITIPTKIQEIVIPIILDNKDCIFTSKTGSGKTLAYLLPIFKKIDVNLNKPQVMILSPTQELASQIYKQAKMIDENCNLDYNVALLVGGSNIKKQIDVLKNKPKIIVGTSGRILELIKLKKIKPYYIKSIVVDEADRMLDSNNIDLVNSIIKTTLKERQLIFTSATIPDKYILIAKEIMNNPQIIKLENSEDVLPTNIEHMFFVADFKKKFELLKKIYNSLKIKKGIVFVNNANTVEIITEKLNYHGIKSISLNGNMYSKDRRNALNNFRNSNHVFLVTSDISSRGLDIENLEYVVNFDIPEDTEIYIHRSGRTGRMNKKGFCINIALSKEIKLIKQHERKLKINIQEKEIYFGKIKNKNIKKSIK